MGVAIRSREFLRRLDKLGLPGEHEPELVPDFGVLSRVEHARFWELYHTLSDEDEEVTEADREELGASRANARWSIRAKPAIPIRRRMRRGARDSY